MFVTNATIYLNGQAVVVEAQIEMPEPPPVNVGEEIYQLQSRMRRLEAIATNQGGMRASVERIGALIQAVQRGEKIQAIKALREATPGLGMKEAKDIIETTWDTFYANDAQRSRPPF